MSGLDMALENAAEVVGCDVTDWLEAAGENTGIGEDYFYVMTTAGGQEVALYINGDQGHWTWQATSPDGTLDAEGELDADDEEETLEEALTRMTDKAAESEGALVLATWTSVWDDGFELDAPCLLTSDLSRVEEIFSVEGVDDDGEELTSLDSEHVTLEDGRRIPVTRDDRGDVVLGTPTAADTVPGP